MATFTIEFEIGPKTREMIQEVVGRATMQLELGPRTLAVVEDLLQKLVERAGRNGA